MKMAMNRKPICNECGVDLDIFGAHKPWCESAMRQSEDKTVNDSGLDPQGCAVLILPYDPEVKNSVIQLPDDVKRRLDTIESRATVIAIGPDAWKGSTPRARVGDKVLVSKYCGAVIKGPWDDIQYRIVNDQDIYCQIVKERHRSTEATRSPMPEAITND